MTYALLVFIAIQIGILAFFVNHYIKLHEVLHHNLEKNNQSIENAHLQVINMEKLIREQIEKLDHVKTGMVTLYEVAEETNALIKANV